MQNVLQQFVARVTGSRDGQFRRARIRLTVMYMAILAVILLIAGGMTYQAFASRLEVRFARFHGRPPIIVVEEVPTEEDVRHDLRNSLFAVHSILLVLAGILSYILAGWTLRPIEVAYAQQRQFLGDASHELRTPLAILRTDLDNALSDNTLSSTERARLLSQREEVDRMGALVADLLHLARFGEAPALHLAPQSVKQMLEEITARLASLANEHTVKLAIGDVADATVHVDRSLFMQALSNMVKNAITYNRENGTVTLSAQTEGRHVVIRVADTGVGIATAHLPHIFDRFYRVDGSRTRVLGGSGLGLAIAKEIIEQCRGKVTVESEPEKGTTFNIILPIHKAS